MFLCLHMCGKRQYYKSVFCASGHGYIFVCTDAFVFTYVSVYVREKEYNKSVFCVSGGGYRYLNA